MTPKYNTDDPILLHVRKDFPVLARTMTIQEALGAIRAKGVGEKIIYFYVTDADGRLAGVLPTRKLLTAPLDERVEHLMVSRVITIPDTATLLEACEMFVFHKLLAFPVVDAEKRIVGVIDIGLFTEEVFDITEREQMDTIFESIGFRVTKVRDASALKAFRFRMPWLIATMLSGMACALLVSVFEIALAKSLVLAFFLTLILGLGESVSVQTMTITIHALRYESPNLSWYARSLFRELGLSLMLGLTCALIVGGFVWFWQRQLGPAVVIAGGIVLSLIMACVIGLSIPTLLHFLKLDLKIAGGPITLALADIFTIVSYFTLAVLVL